MHLHNSDLQCLLRKEAQPGELCAMDALPHQQDDCTRVLAVHLEHQQWCEHHLMAICAEGAGIIAIFGKTEACHIALVSITHVQLCVAVRLRRRAYSTSIEQQRVLLARRWSNEQVLSAHLLLIQPMLQGFSGSIFSPQLCG